MKVGSFPYWYGSEEVLEDIPAEELFRPETIESARNIPLTNDHPEVMVDPENWEMSIVGWCSEPEQEGDYLVATITVMDPMTIEQIISGERRELSAGYTCSMDNTTQRNIIFNHASVVEVGRCGSDVALRLNAKKANNMNEEENKINEEECDHMSADCEHKDAEEQDAEKENEDGFTAVLSALDMSAEDFVSALRGLMSKDNEEEEEEAEEEEEKESAAHEEEEEEKNNAADDLVARKVDVLLACQRMNVKADAKMRLPELELALVQEAKKHMETANKSEEYIRALADDVIASIDTVVAAPKKKSVLNRVDVVAHEEEEDRIEAAKRIARMR
jgi:hypothetical protein